MIVKTPVGTTPVQPENIVISSFAAKSTPDEPLVWYCNGLTPSFIIKFYLQYISLFNFGFIFNFS